MRWSAVVLAGAVATAFLAGCARGPGPEGVDKGLSRPVEQAVALNFTADLLLQRVSLHRGLAIGIGLPGDHNCVWLPDTQVPIAQKLQVRATWKPRTPLWDHLEMTLQTEEGHNANQPMVAGASPLEIAVENVTADHFFEGIGVILQPEIPGAVLDQAVHLEFNVVGTGIAAPTLKYGDCVWGRL